MKKLRILSLFLLLSLLLAACGQRTEETPPVEEVPPAEEPAPETETPAEEPVPEDIPEGAAVLTAEEIAQVNEAFESVLQSENGSYANPICCFFTSLYQRPEEIDLSEFLYLFSPGTKLSDEEEFRALKAVEGWPFGMDSTLETMLVPVHKYLREDVDAALMEHAGITTADLTGVRGKNAPLYLYLPEYDAYYNFTSDFGPGIFRCESGWYTDEEARLTSIHSVLTLQKDGDRWLFQSFLPLEEE